MLYIFGLVLNIPNVFTFRPDLDKTANGSIWMLQETEFSKSQANYEYKFWIHCFLICILPLAIMIVLNVRIAICIRESFSTIQNHLSAISTRTKQVGLKPDTSLLIHIFQDRNPQHPPNPVFCYCILPSSSSVGVCCYVSLV